MNKWDKRFIELAYEISKWSVDPSRKIGAVIVNQKNMIVSTGWNGFPRGIADTEERYLNREIKYKYIVHAEANAIYNATYNGINLDGCTLYVYGLPVCSECAKAIIQVGIRRVIMRMQKDDNPTSWIESFKYTKLFFEEVGIQYEFV
jgi:dCMP deaminase